ncbi:MAG: hypothetical protein F7C07_00535 [Desulfurococcales archaeon]|nr:hypothetical protein [Desulfurococcales archaeon]
MDRPKRLLKRRELAALWLLSREGPTDIGEALDVLSREMCVTRRTAMSIIKALARLGLVSLRVSGGRIDFRVVDPLTYVRSVALSYIESRRRKCGR